jgi:hypothetical protein
MPRSEVTPLARSSAMTGARRATARSVRCRWASMTSRSWEREAPVLPRSCVRSPFAAGEAFSLRHASCFEGVAGLVFLPVCRCRPWC